MRPVQPEPNAPTSIAELPGFWDLRRRTDGKPDCSRCAAELRVALQANSAPSRTPTELAETVRQGVGLIGDNTAPYMGAAAKALRELVGLASRPSPEEERERVALKFEKLAAEWESFGKHCMRGDPTGERYIGMAGQVREIVDGLRGEP